MNIIKKTAIFAHLALISITVTEQDKLIIKGSDTLGAKMIPKIAEAYENKNPGTKFEIAAEGSSTGIAAIIDGTAHIGMSSRELKGKEKASAGANGVRLVKTVIANDAVAIIANASNPIGDLSAKDIERIFTGDITNWSVAAAWQDFSLHEKHFIRNLCIFPKVRDGRERLRIIHPKDGRQRTDCHRGVEKPKRHRIRGLGLRRSKRNQDCFHRQGHAYACYRQRRKL